jgi:hypothetical protein
MRFLERGQNLIAIDSARLLEQPAQHRKPQRSEVGIVVLVAQELDKRPQRPDANGTFRHQLEQPQVSSRCIFWPTTGAPSAAASMAHNMNRAERLIVAAHYDVPAAPVAGDEASWAL